MYCMNKQSELCNYSAIYSQSALFDNASALPDVLTLGIIS